MSSTKSAEQFFKAYAHDFDAIYGGKRGAMGWLIDRTLRKSMRLRFERTIAGCVPVAGRTVLDVGCGPGHYCVALAREGAARVVGVDLAEEMLVLAKKHAEDAGVADRCKFIRAAFETYNPSEPFDFCIVMGVMDYIENAEAFVRHALEVTCRSVFFSFPADWGVLAAIRRLRYRHRTPLFLYPRSQLDALFEKVARGKYSIERLARDFFVQVDI